MSFSKAKYLKFAILIISLSIFIGAISACLPLNISLPELEEEAITTLSRPTTPTTGGFSYFDNGVKYVFTDKTKVDGFRAGTEDYDITTVTVDSSEAQGTQKNPHVITNIDEWEVFVKTTATNTTYGAGQYYVLAADIDFSGETFHPVSNFNGTFYGLGYALKNITVNGTWYYWTGTAYAAYTTSTSLSLGAYGVFCRIVGATITDLIVDNYSFQNTPLGYQAYSSHGPYIGGVVGISYGNDSILNCHTSGEIPTTLTYSTYTVYGGIVGTHGATSYQNTGLVLLVYRCSAEISGQYKSTTSSRAPVGAGIIGYHRSEIAYVYDCAANAKISYSATYDYYAACVSRTWGGPLTIENFVGTLDITAGASSHAGALVGTSQNTVTVKNVYVEGKRGATDSAKNSMYAIAGEQALTAAKVSNINSVKSTSSYGTMTSGCTNALPAGSYVEYSNSDLMLAAAKSFFSADAYSNIWDVSKIGGLYTPDESPVRNYLVATITFKNLLSDDKEQDITSVPTDDYLEGDILPSPTNNSDFAAYIATKTYHEFLGWTTDKTGETEPWEKLPKGVFGDVTLYAVWGLTETYIDSYITTSLTLKDNISKIEYDSVSSITLTANVTHSGPSSGGMTNPRVTYSFLQDGDEKKTTDEVKSNGVLSVKTVPDSGEYSFNYQIKDGLEPLWFYDGEYSVSEKIEIEKGKQASMTIKNFKLSTSTVPYYGMEVGELEYTVTMYNKASKEVTLDQLGWKLEQFTIVKGTNTGDGVKIKVYPTDKVNYEEYYEFEVEFESQALVIEFNMPRISDKLEVEVKYGQNYGAAEIIYLFEQEYLKALSTWSSAVLSIVQSKEPYFDGKSIANGSADRFDTAFNDIQEKKTIEVTFETVTYTITFDQDDGVSTPIQEPYSYGQYLKKPTPDPVKDGYILVGWYFDETTYDDNGNATTTSRAWRFNSVGDVEQDRVTGEITLKAKWLKPTSLESIKIEVDPSKKFSALSQIQEGDLIVTATYKGEVDTVSVSQDVVLSWLDYKSGISYSSPDDVLHVKEGGYEVTVNFSYGSSSASDTIKIPVVPISISTSKLTFADLTKIYDGDDTPVTMTPVKGTWPAGIVDINYIYTKGGEKVDPDTVHGIGTWIVRAEFVTESADYAADAMLATLRIVRQTTLDKPTFTGKVTYDGTEKNIEDYLEDFDEDYMVIVGSGAKATDVGTYTVTIQLVDGVTWADGTDNDITVPWKIEKATLIPDWDKWEFVLADAATGSGFAPVINGIASGIADADKDNIDYATDFTYKIYDADGNLLGVSEVSDTGTYKIVASINASSSLYKNYQFNGVSNEWYFVVVPEEGMDILTIEWSDTEFLYDGVSSFRPTYIVKDRDGIEVTDTTILSQLVFDNYEYKTEIATYTIKVSVKDSDRYFIRTGSTCKWKIVNVLGEEPPEEGSEDTQKPSSGNENGSGAGSIDLGNVIQYWPLLVSVISIILIMLFLSKAASYNSARKKFNKKSEKLERVYAGLFSGTLFGMSMTIWATIAFTLAGLAIVSFIIMLICKSKCSKAEEAYEENLDEYNRNKAEYDEKRREEEMRKRDESMQMMFMSMMGGQGGQGMQGAYAGMQPGIGVEEMRGLISETVTALLPNAQQALPQQASHNDELVEKLIAQNEKLMEKLANQSGAVAVAPAGNYNDEAIKTLIEGQRIIMEKLANQQPAQPQVIEKEVVKEVPVEKIVEKEVKVEVPVEVEKIVEKEVPVEVIKEVPVEVIKEVKVEVPVKAEPKPKKETAPRLTLDEAYALLSKEQKKFFDGLKQYVLDKYKCKEKKTTYFVTYGQTATNPLLKLMIKKNITVALLKMEDELMKDIRRDATGDGTKVKVKETEILVTDAQAFETAKKMIDLRYDQIERYADLLKEQRSLRRG